MCCRSAQHPNISTNYSMMFIPKLNFIGAVWQIISKVDFVEGGSSNFSEWGLQSG